MTRLAQGLSVVAVMGSAALCLAWMNPTRDRIAEGNALFKHGKYDEAISKYGQVLVDDPDSSLLNFNMGDANYKAGKLSEALASFARVHVEADDPKRTAKIAYNAGNVQYRLGAAAENDKPQDALTAYVTALAAYRRALGADPADRDAKFNYEFVSQRIDDLKKKLEEQKKQQEQQPPQDQQQPDQQQDKQEQGAQQKEGEKQPEQQPQKPDQGDQQQQAQPEKSDDQKRQEQQQAGQQRDSQKDAQQQQERAAQAAGASGEKSDKMSQQEAAAVIDTAKNDELQADEFARRVQGGAVAEPAQDW